VAAPAPSPTPSSWWARPDARRWRGEATSDSARRCHLMLPGYAVTPLVDAPALARRWSLGQVFVKDESSRFGLPSFKALGVSYALARLLAERADQPISTSWPQLLSQAATTDVTLVTATDGNHGRALAHFAAMLNLRCEVVVPAVMSEAAAAAIAAEGADVTRIDGSYDDAVAAAAATDSVAGRVLVQDTSWPGYEVIPGWIVEGYQTMLAETAEQLRAQGRAEPDLVAVPVGVGSLAQAVVAYYRDRQRQVSTSVLSCEPDSAACVLASLLAGEPRSVATAFTNMAGLNCGTPTSLGWPVLSGGLDAAITVTDEEATRAVDELARFGVGAGASGAAALAGVEAALTGPEASSRRAALGLDPSSVVVLLNTEGPSGAGGLA
ncbi:MAG: diaminopropionate ammonia-lyase, partial [Microlunatus sp.]|nr:diaminopropionate ammonia-lyase [Microlunatus sp.]